MNSRYLANKSVVNLWFYIRDLEQTNVEGRFGGRGGGGSQKMLFPLSWRSVVTNCDSFLITKCDKCFYKVWQVLQSATILLQSATEHRRLAWVTTVVASGLPQFAHAPTPTEKGDWWDWLISVDFWSTQLSLLSDVFRQCWSFSSTKFSCKFRIHSGRSSRTFGFHCFVVLYHLLIDEVNCSHTSTKIITKAV